MTTTTTTMPPFSDAAIRLMKIAVECTGNGKRDETVCRKPESLIIRERQAAD